MTVTKPTVTVTYLVVSRWYGGFEGEVAVINRGPSTIPGWQIVVALPYDQFRAVSSNASGYASHHILLLNPASDANSVPAEGTLSVFFTAYGTRLTPQLCAFNDTTCG
jgi:chitin-binding protein